MAKEKISKNQLEQSVQIPEGVDVEIAGDIIKIKKENKSVSRKLSGISMKKDGNLIILSTPRATRRERKTIMTFLAHIKNMLQGMNEKFSYKLKICNVHFPMNVSVDKSSNEVIIKNFLGEKRPRKANILENVDVSVKGDEIIVDSFDKENAGQTAANIEKITKIRLRDRRIFQDGIFITEKNGRRI